jgi:hypothetical protein
VALDFEKIKSQTSLAFSAFTQSCGSDDTWLLLINNPDPFRAFGTSATSANSTNSLRLRLFGTSGFGCSGFLSISHFKSPEAHFPKGLDRLPPIPFKINGSYSLRGLFLWRYTSRKFALPNARESLIWTALGIFVVERLKLPSTYASILETNC